MEWSRVQASHSFAPPGEPEQPTVEESDCTARVARAIAVAEKTLRQPGQGPSLASQAPECPGWANSRGVHPTDAGARIVDALVGEAVMAPVRDLIARVSDSGAPTLVSANAYERGGLNAIPAAPLRPVPAGWQGYDRPPEDDSTDTRHSVFDPRIIVLGIKNKQVSLPATLKLTAALRGLLMGACPEQPPPEWFSGHRRDATPTSAPHLALIPLPFVGSQHADGRIMGLALVLPRVLDPMEAGRCLEPCLRDPATGLAREHRLFSAQWLGCTVELEARERLPRNLDPNTWTRPARVWASVTPVVLNRHFDGKDKWDRAADSVKGACEHIGLPRPREVLLHPVSMVEGTPPAREYPQLARKSDGGRRSHNHAVIVFDEPVCGPVIVGAGRFRGYGLCRPMDG